MNNSPRAGKIIRIFENLFDILDRPEGPQLANESHCDSAGLSECEAV